MNDQNNNQIIIIDDEAIVRDAMLQTLELEGFQARAFEDPREAFAHCSMSWPGVVICDVRMEIMGGLDVLKHILDIDHEIPVIMFSAHADIAVAIQAIRLGAYDFLEKTNDPEHQINTINRASKKRQLVLENRRLRQAIDGQHIIETRLIGQSVLTQRLRESVLQLAEVDVDLIINGATGTGKEVVAKCLHDFSSRADKPFVALNCGALSESIIESELFGHEAGAFTGALKRRIGKIEYANGGTLFLDEIESMPASLQVQMLRVLQERTLQRLGGNSEINVDIRVLAASKVSLREAADEGEFREDLYYRLNVASIDIPTLDQRKEDIPLLFKHFVDQASQRAGRKAALIPGTLLFQLSQTAWSGNIRELRNAAERWFIGLPLNIDQAFASISETDSLDDNVANYERAVISAALSKHKGHIENTAQALCIPRKKLYLRMKKYGLERDDFLCD
ncbi:sigma-54-dependent transcriptional regulator [Leucothrix pacifica]|uniref:Fis family transcriptional regulator n=1 Tax=Leucothrix pacifica TaxID=1247513 RepID=A0A317CI39_9GAMM|nr:sigma-54 dependent transcriptional regulator [Leucothrix pacifica]PWQ98238.1 Fis family transcriptional regulator [Leucothrix pacifica]